jgi:hypothetical protein
MNAKPDKLHRFYTKKSHYLYGVEGEETEIYHGQAEIHQKIMSIDLVGCKIFVVSVDAQPSADNGILVHVIGELSNKDGPFKKFVQVFFLAEQPNGYFVLNDNFRFLKEEGFDESEDENDPTDHDPDVLQGVRQAGHPHTNGTLVPSTDLPSQLAVSSHLSQPVLSDLPAQPIVSAAASHSPLATMTPPVNEPALVERVVEPPRPASPEPVVAPASVVPDVVVPEREPTPSPASPSPAAISRNTPSPAPATPAAPVIEPSQTAAPVTASPAPPATHPPTAATPSVPPAPKTWASLAATNPSKWGQKVAQEAKGLTSQPHPPSAAAAPSHPRERPAGGSSSSGVPTAGGDATLQPGGVGPRGIPPSQQHVAYAAALAVTTSLCFIKGVTDNITQVALEQLLTTRFGPIKECEIVRNKACAFLEFKSIDSAKKAIIASLPIQQGGEGGLKLDEEKHGGQQQRIVVETRKERGDRPQPRPRVMTGDGGGRGAPTGYPQGANAGGNPGYNNRGRGGPARGRGDAPRSGRA